MCVGLQNLAKTQTGQLEIPPDLNGTVVELLYIVVPGIPSFERIQALSAGS
jgi:hypothetical protein